MAFNQSHTGLAGKAENKLEREELKHGVGAGRTGFNETGRTGMTGTGMTGTGLGARGVRDEQYTERNMQGVSGVSGIRTEVTGQSEAFCPNPNTPGLAKEFETRVQVIEKVPEMKTVTKTDYVKQIEERQETVLVPKTKVVMEEKERVDMVPHVREIPKTRTEIRHRVVEEQVEVPYTVKEVVNVPVPRKETVPRVVTEQVEETVTVPVVREVPVQRQVQVPTGNYCEQPINQYEHAGKGLPTGLHGEKLHQDHGLLNKEVGANRSTPLSRNDSSSSSSGYDDGVATTGAGHRTGLGTSSATTTTGTTGTTGTGFGSSHTTTGTAAPHKKSLLQKIEDKLMPGHKH